MISKHLDLLLEGLACLTLHHLCEGVAHHCNKHVHEHDLRQHRSDEEENPSQAVRTIGSFNEVLNDVKFTKTQLVLVNERVEDG